MKAGRELDVLVAEKLEHLILPKNSSDPRTVGAQGDTVPPYSTDIQLAFPLAERFRLFVIPSTNGWAAGKFLQGDIDVGSKEYVDDNCTVLVQAGTAPLAICLAALQLGGIRVGESETD